MGNNIFGLFAGTLIVIVLVAGGVVVIDWLVRALAP